MKIMPVEKKGPGRPKKNESKPIPFEKVPTKVEPKPFTFNDLQLMQANENARVLATVVSEYLSIMKEALGYSTLTAAEMYEILLDPQTVAIVSAKLSNPVRIPK